MLIVSVREENLSIDMLVNNGEIAQEQKILEIGRSSAACIWE